MSSFGAPQRGRGLSPVVAPVPAVGYPQGVYGVGTYQQQTPPPPPPPKQPTSTANTRQVVEHLREKVQELQALIENLEGGTHPWMNHYCDGCKRGGKDLKAPRLRCDRCHYGTDYCLDCFNKGTPCKIHPMYVIFGRDEFDAEWEEARVGANSVG